MDINEAGEGAHFKPKRLSSIRVRARTRGYILCPHNDVLPLEGPRTTETNYQLNACACAGGSLPDILTTPPAQNAIERGENGRMSDSIQTTPTL